MTPSLIDYVVQEPEVPPTPTVEVDAVGVYVVDEGDDYDAETFGDRLVVCTCDDDKHAKRDRHQDRMFKLDDRRYADHMATHLGGHVVPVHLYLVVGDRSPQEDPS